MWRPLWGKDKISEKAMMRSELGPAFTRLRTAPAGLYGSLPTCLPDKTRGRSMRLQKEVQGINTQQHGEAFLENIQSMHLSVPHLDEGVQSLSIRLQELCFNVHHVDLCPGNHCPDKNTIRGAQPLTTHTHTHTHRLSAHWVTLLDFPSSSISSHGILTFIDLYNRSAKNAGLFRMHFTARQQGSHRFSTSGQMCAMFLWRSRDAPTARKTSSREPDISLLMLSSISLPEIFRYSSNTKGRRRAS